MVFLNDVEDGGESAFPIADNLTFNWEVNICKRTQNTSLMRLRSVGNVSKETGVTSVGN